MTPVKLVRYSGRTVVFLDFADMVNPVCTCETEDMARQVALAFAAWHNVPLEEPEGYPKVTDDETL